MIHYFILNYETGGLFTFHDKEQRDKALAELRKEFPDNLYLVAQDSTPGISRFPWPITFN